MNMNELNRVVDFVYMRCVCLFPSILSVVFLKSKAIVV